MAKILSKGICAREFLKCPICSSTFAITASDIFDVSDMGLHPEGKIRCPHCGNTLIVREEDCLNPCVRMAFKGLKHVEVSA